MMLKNALLTLITGVLGHGAMTQPPSRNAIVSPSLPIFGAGSGLNRGPGTPGAQDKAVAPWNGSVPESVPFMFWCAAPDSDSADPRKVSGAHGQACCESNPTAALSPRRTPPTRYPLPRT